MTTRGFRPSSQQEQLWARGRQARTSYAQIALLLEGRLEAGALRRAARGVVERHEILRTTFSQPAGMKFPLQVISETAVVLWAEEDLRGLNEPELTAAAGRALEAHRVQPFNPENGPAVDCLLLHLKPERAVLSLKIPALCADAMTLANFIQEMAAFMSSSEASPAGEDVTQYLQFSEWQNELLEDEESKPGLEYWRERLEAVSRPPKLPFAKEAAERKAFEPSFHDSEISPEVAHRLEMVAAECGASTSTFLLTCWRLLHWRLSDREETAIACVLDGRRIEELQDAFGLFARAVPLNFRPDDGARVADVVRATSRIVKNSYRWLDYFPPEYGDGGALSDGFPPTAFEYVEWPTPLDAGGVRISLYGQSGCWDFFRLKLLCQREGGSLTARIQYDRHSFDGEDIRHLAEQFRALVGSAAEDSSALIKSLSPLTPAERRQLSALNETAVEWEADVTLHRLFEEQVRKTPDDVALVFEDRRLSYAELNRRANILAHRLQTMGVGPETLVCLSLERTPDMVVSILATLKAGGAYVPIEPTLPRHRVLMLLEETGARVVVTHEQFAGNFEGRQGALLVLGRDWPEDGGGVDDPPGRARAENLAYVLFTSGSTGRPKGVMVEHRQLVNYVRSITAKLGLPVGTHYAMVSTFAADLGNTVLFASLCGGGCLHLVPRETATDPEAYADYSRRHGIECLKIVPSHLSALLTATRPEDVIPGAALVLGGEASNWRLIESILERSPACRIINHYGPTETTVGAMALELNPRSVGRRGAGMPLGEPLGNSRVYLLDDHLKQVGAWVAADLYIGGAGVSRGYLNRPGLTAESFIPDHLSAEPGARSYRTGDRVRLLPDNSMEFLGRADHQVKLRGFRIELNEIEGAIRRYASVREAVVDLREDRPGEPQLAAYVVPHPGAQFSTAELYSFLRERLPDYMVPSHFMRLESLPITANGKVDRRALPAPSNIRSGEARSGFSPSGIGEELLADLWREVLGVRELSVGDNFFRLGGDSLLAIQLVSRVRKAFQIEMPVQSLFNAPTLSEFALEVERTMLKGVDEQLSKILPAPRDAALPLSFMQEQLWSAYKLDPLNTAYNNIASRRLRGPLDVAAMRRVLDEIVRRHEILRTIFPAREGETSQVIVPPSPVDLRQADLEALPEGERESEVQRYIETEANTPFNLERGPLLRMSLLRLDEQTHVFLLAMHHIITDRWSFTVFTTELVLLYEAFRHGLPSPLPEPSLQYADYSYWQRRWLRGELLDKLTSYWTRQLGGAPEVINLPTDYARPARQSFEGATAGFHRPPELLAGLKALSAQEGCTLFMTLLCAFYVLLYHYSGDEDIVVGTDVANRNRIEVEGLIGFFVNNLALRTDLSGNPTFRGLLGRVRAVALGAYTHQSLPFSTLVKALRVKRTLSHTPVFQVLCVLQNTSRSGAALSDLEVDFVEPGLKTSKFDLALFMAEDETGLFEGWTYSTSLFKPETISQMGEDFQNILENAVRQPDLPLSKLKPTNVAARKKMRLEKSEFEKVKSKGFKRTGQRPVNLSEVEPISTGYLQDGQALPLVLRPNMKDVDLVSWVAARRDYVEALLHKHGALLFRGFNIDTIPDFEHFAAAACREIYGEYGDLPREQESKRVYQSTPYPNDKAILFHNESSHLTQWPMKQFFYCVQPAERGGETPIVDCRRIYAALPPEILRQFEARQLMYVRNFSEGLDVNWRDFFRTDNPEDVNAFCRKSSTEIEWTAASLRTRQRRAAVSRHPKTGEMVFFNQIQLHHVSCLSADVREALFSFFPLEELPRNVYYGDGTPIEDRVVQTITDLYWQNAVSFPWEKGDILMLDNMLVAHARLPYVGPRKIVVAMGDILS